MNFMCKQVWLQDGFAQLDDHLFHKLPESYDWLEVKSLI